MTNYKRFVSYLYSYEMGQKKENVGFARIESSDEICKVTVHCVLRIAPKKKFKVYLLKRQTSNVISKEVDNCDVKDSSLDVKLSFPKGIIESNTFDFKDCIGIILMTSKENYIGAKWDESPISYHEASLIDQSNNMYDKRTIPDQSTSVPKKETPIEFQEEPVNKDELRDTDSMSMSEQMNQKATMQMVSQDELKEVEPKLETSVVEPEIISNEVKIKENTEKSVEEGVEEKALVPEIKSNDLSSEQEDANQEPEGDSTQIVNEGDIKSEEITSEENKEEEHVSAAGSGAAAAIDMSIWIDHPAARAILNRFVRMYPFDDGEIAECVRLEPKDIGLFPMYAWTLGNNSFVLHSYCNFRHLLFAKKLTREGCVYYLMVPGALNPKEKQLAKMFGFNNFKCSRRRCMRDGEFGYWFVEIKFV